MAQLSDDTQAFDGPLMRLDEAQRRLFETIKPVAESEQIEVMAAAGRVLATDLIASFPLPGFDNSAVDGYAARFHDLAADSATRLRIVERVTAGSAAVLPLAAGEAARIFTGAPLPQGADTVFMQEDVRREDDMVIVPPGLKRGANARFTGEDIAQGAVALPAGKRLKPQDVALASALGQARLTVRRRLRLAILSTGNEVHQPGAILDKAGLYDANRPMLAALAVAAGASVTDGGIVRDEPQALAETIDRLAGHCDVILSSGGVSTGEEDHVKTVIEQAGRLDWWRVGIKPGRPVALGAVRGTAYVGLPGNPVAAYVTFTQIVRPLLAALSGEDWQRPRAQAVQADFAYRKKKGRREFVRVRLSAATPLAIAHKHGQDGAGVITSLTGCDGLIELADDLTKVEAGDILPFYGFEALAV